MKAQTISRTAAAACVAFTITSSTVSAKPGDLDITFGSGGKVTTSLGSNTIAFASTVIRQQDGKILVGGNVDQITAGAQFDFALVRYNSNGTLDATFGSGGKVVSDLGTNQDLLSAIAIRPGISNLILPGIYAAGRALNGQPDFALASYTNDGNLITTFGNAGKVITNIGAVEGARAMAVQGAVAVHKIVLGGDTTVNFATTNADIALARYTSSGALDSTFGSGGIVITDIDSAFDECAALKIQSDGKIVVGGRTAVGNITAFVFVRYNSDGTLDPTFGSAGKAVVDFPGLSAECNDIALQPDGRIVAAGFSETPPAALLAQLNANGTVDITFGTNGRVITSGSTTLVENVHAMQLQPDGKILVVGDAEIGADREFGIARYRQNGAIDTSFGEGGRATVDCGGSNETANGAVIQSDGTIVVAGSSIVGGGRDFALASLKTAQGDVRVGLPGDIPIGDDIVNLTGAGQTQRVVIRRGGGVKNVILEVQNDTAANDSFTVRGTRGNGRFKIKYLTGGKNVTAAVLRGTLDTGELTPGSIFALKAKIKASTKKSRKKRKFSLSATSDADANSGDVAMIRTRSR